jgi:integrase
MDVLLAEAGNVIDAAITERTRYQYRLLAEAYEFACSSIPNMVAWPATEDSVIAYLTFRKNYEKVKYRTIRVDLAALRFRISTLNDPDPTRSRKFLSYMIGLRRDMHGDLPSGMLPMTGEILTRMAAIVNRDDVGQVKFMALLTLGFFGFFRVSELLVMPAESLTFFDDRLEVRLLHSKTDQTWHGDQCYIARNAESPYSAWNWNLLFLQKLGGEVSGPLFEGLSYSVARSQLRTWLTRAGVDPAGFGTHSLRRGGATAAARAGIQDSVIQKHGRWKSSCFMRYTSIERQEAGRRITVAI